MTVLLLVFAAGAAVAGLHALGGLLLTPFFGSSPFFWANVIASFPLSVSIGLLLGQLGARAARKNPVLPFRVGAGAGLLLIAVPIALAPLARAILDRDPDAMLATPLTVLVLITFPSAAAVATLPLALVEGTRRGKGEKAAAAGAGIGGGSLLVLALGGIAGTAGIAPTLLDPGAHDWLPMLLLGACLVAAASTGLGATGRVLALALALGGGTAFIFTPNEVRTLEYRRALTRAWTLRVGRYYLETAGRRVLDGSEVASRYEELREKIAYAPDKSVAAVLVVETLKGLGVAQVTGDGLRQILDLYLPKDTKPRVMPLLDAIDTVQSDGKGTISFTLRHIDLNGAPLLVSLPDEKGGTTTFEFKSDFTLTLNVQKTAEEARTSIDVGPREVEKAGFFDANDTYRTPILVKNVALFFDAHLIGFTVITRRDRVVVRVRAQGAVGAVQESVLQVIDLAGSPKGSVDR